MDAEGGGQMVIDSFLPPPSLSPRQEEPGGLRLAATSDPDAATNTCAVDEGRDKKGGIPRITISHAIRTPLLLISHFSPT